MEGILYLIPFIILTWWGVSYFFKAAGEAQWKAFVPVYNVVIWLKIIKKPVWWVVLSFIPVVNIVLCIGMVVELLNSFNYRNKAVHVLGAVFPYLLLPYLGIKEELDYDGPVDYSKQKKGMFREWAEALFFAIIAATAIRAFVIEAFVIPTGSMERTLRVYDCLFVNKMSYGTRFTMTPLSVPFSHQTIMGTSIKSYSDLVKLPYFRFPKLEEVDNGDMVVFNYPQEDFHPIDKRSHYIKRCLGIPGDSLKIVDGTIYVNNEAFENAETYQLSYTVQSKSMLSNQLLEAYEVSPGDRGHSMHNGYYLYDIAMPAHMANQMKQEPSVVSVEKNITPRGEGTSQMFDASKKGIWSVDNFGPIYLPKQGDQIKLDDDNIGQFKRVISVYEGNKLYIKEDIREAAKTLSVLTSNLNQINVKQVFTLANREHLSGRRGQNFYQMFSLVSEVKNNFLVTQVPNEILKLADEFYWKDNANFSDADMQDLAVELQSFVTANTSKELEKLKSLFAEFKDSEEMYLINGVLTNEYTFKKDYYFMIGDNRHRSADSRYFGYVPHDHIVGKPVFVWMSISDTKEGGILERIRWDRVCSFVDRDGLSRSYKIEVLILILAWTAFNQLYWKKRKAKKKLKN